MQIVASSVPSNASNRADVCLRESLYALSRALNSALECGVSICFESGEFNLSITLAQWKHTHKATMSRGPMEKCGTLLWKILQVSMNHLLST